MCSYAHEETNLIVVILSDVIWIVKKRVTAHTYHAFQRFLFPAQAFGQNAVITGMIHSQTKISEEQIVLLAEMIDRFIVTAVK